MPIFLYRSREIRGEKSSKIGKKKREREEGKSEEMSSTS